VPLPPPCSLLLAAAVPGDAALGSVSLPPLPPPLATSMKPARSFGEAPLRGVVASGCNVWNGNNVCPMKPSGPSLPRAAGAEPRRLCLRVPPSTPSRDEPLASAARSRRPKGGDLRRSRDAERCRPLLLRPERPSRLRSPGGWKSFASHSMALDAPSAANRTLRLAARRIY
jgi:hypothetical protein